MLALAMLDRARKLHSRMISSPVRLLNKAIRALVPERFRQAPGRTDNSYRLVPASMGMSADGVNLDKALRLADALEDEAIARRSGHHNGNSLPS